MLRYDPTKNDHEKYEKARKRKTRHTETESEPSKHMKLNDDSEFQVSKEQFFNVTNQLTSALKPASEGFSLLSMFGRDIVETKQRNPYQEITLSKGQQTAGLTNSNSMFNDDSSDDEIIQERLTKSQNPAANESKKEKNSKKNSKAEIRHEPFFIFGNDQRLQGKLN